MKIKFAWVACILAALLAGCVSYKETETIDGRTTVSQYGMFAHVHEPHEWYEVTIVNTSDIRIDIVDRNGVIAELDVQDHAVLTVKDPYLRAEPHRWTDRSDYGSATYDCAKSASAHHQVWNVLLKKR